MGIITDMLVLSDVETAVVGRAFDRAWDGFLKKHLLTPHNLHDARTRLAELSLRSVLQGECDEWRLARDAVVHVQQHLKNQGCLPAVTSLASQQPSGRSRFRKRLAGARRASVPTDGQIARAA